MTEQKDPVAAAIDDARALMDALIANDWSEIHVTGDDFAIFIAKEDGGSNPMLALAEVDEPADLAPVHPAKTISAPHVATLDWIAAVGDLLEPGQVVARLSVLDEPSEITAPRSGTILRVHASPGDLVEFGTPLVDLVEAG